MEIASLPLVFALGAIIGSFFNVLILRYNTGRGIGGRSACYSCGKKLRSYELVPILSYAAQRGKCRGCKSRISPQYPLVEALTGLMFALLFSQAFAGHTGIFMLLLDLFVFSVLLLIAVYDVRHTIIPDGLVTLFIGASLVKLAAINPVLYSYPYVLDLLAGPLFAVPFYLLWRLSKGRWIGLGDAKLVIGFGWFLGLSLGLSAIVMGFWIGALYGIAAIGVSALKPMRGGLTLKSELPFAPFLILGFSIAYFTGVDVVGLSLFL